MCRTVAGFRDKPTSTDRDGTLAAANTRSAASGIMGSDSTIGEPPLFHDPMGSDRPRVRVTAVLAATWQDPIGPTLMHSGVFVARADSCSDAAGKAPLVFRDAANLMPASADAHAPVARSKSTQS